MPQLCILTDNTAQFPVPVFPGRNLVQVISLHVENEGEYFGKSEGVKANDFPKSLNNGHSLKAIAPSVEEFELMFASLGQHYEEILTIVHSANFSKTYENAQLAVENSKGREKIHVVDAQTISTGLGLVVQAAAAAAEEGKGASEIEDYIRNLLPRLYTLFFIEGLTYLHNTEYLGKGQALIAEHMKMLPMFVLDNEEFVPTQKARNYRHLVDLLHEFLCEFLTIDHVAILQGIPPFENETIALRERMALDFIDTPISEHTINAPLAAIIGPRSLGMFVLQAEE